MEYIEEFRIATKINTKFSIEEPGVARFDVLHQQNDLTKFVLVEVYRTPQDPAKHKKTTHYVIWIEDVENVAQSLLQVYQDGGHVEGRRLMSVASLFSGMALANAKLGAVHGIAGAFGGLYTAPHCAVCA